jgi:hypothetical protein
MLIILNGAVYYNIYISTIYTLMTGSNAASTASQDTNTMAKAAGLNVDTSKIGDVGKFVGLAIGNAIQILFIGYLGSCMLSLCDLTDPYDGADPKTLDFIFPTNLDALPYSCPNKDASSCKYAGGDVRTTSSGGKQWFKVIFEVLWPMNSLSFPYSNYYSNPLYQGQFMYSLWDWMAWTCAGAFAKYRAVYKAYILVMAAMARTGGIGDIIVFYLMPYLTLLLFCVPPFPQLWGSMLAWWCSIFTPKVEDSQMWAFAPLCGAVILLGSMISSITACCTCGCFAWVLGLVAFLVSILVYSISTTWITLIGLAIGFWSAMVTLFAPVMWKGGGGFADMKKQFRAHRKGLLIYFIVSTACGAGAMLTPTVSSGVIVGGVIALYYVIFKGGSDKGGSES